MSTSTVHSTRLLPDGTPLHNRLLAALPAADYARIQTYLHMHAGVTGRTLQVMPGPTASKLVAMLMRTEEPKFPRDFHEPQRAALQEIGRILVGAYLNALSQFVRLPLRTSPPAVAIDMAAAVMTTSYLNFGSDEDHVFCVNARLGVDTSGDLPAHFLLIPDAAALAEILRSLGVA